MPVSRVLLVALLGLGYWETFTVEGIEIFMYVLLHQPWVSYDADCLGVHLSLSPGLTFRLNGMDIPNDNIFRISVTNFTVSSSNSNGLECRAERTEAQTSEFTNGYLVANGTSPIQAGIILYYGDPERGWDTRRVVSGNRRFHYLRRRESSSEEGYYSCNIQGELNSPAGLYILYPSESPYHDTVIHTHSLPSPVSSVTATIEVLPEEASFIVRCTSTGGRALDMTVSGPRGSTTDISSRIQPVGERRWLGSDQYTATTDLIPRGEHGDEYECNVTSSRSQTGRVSVRGKGWSCV